MNSNPVRTVGSYLYIPQDYIPEPKMLLGWSQKKGDPTIVAEDNLVNRIVLGMPPSDLQVQFLELPDDDRLEEYQKRDVAKMALLGNCLNLNRMGLGKTVETIKALQQRSCTDIVILAPKPVCSQWADQIKVWWPERSDDIGLFDLRKPIKILNYEKLLQTSVLYKLRGTRHDAVVFDEVHLLKNKDSKRTTASKSIPAGVHFGLSGTPILNKPDDLWSLLNSVDWRYSGKSYWAFVNYFCDVELGQFGRTIKGVTKDPARLAILHKLLGLVAIYNDVQVAPGKRRIEVSLEMDSKQKRLYKQIKDLVFEELPENCTISNGAVLAMRLQQATSWPELFIENCPGVKFEWIENFCSSTDEQVVIMTRFERTAEALARYLNKHKTLSLTYTGKKNARELQDAKNMFIKGKIQVLIGTISAMGTGVDGLQVARLGIMVERSWSPEINAQCEDRLNRRGQENPVVWYYLNCAKTFDKHVDKVNLDKADSIRAVLEMD